MKEGAVPYTAYRDLKEGDEYIRLGGYCVKTESIPGGKRDGDYWRFSLNGEHMRGYQIYVFQGGQECYAGGKSAGPDTEGVEDDRL